ncbi:MAG: Rid family detoxifying hydrolase [Bacillota bacterium]|nr:Rid family detoxifying hydrolase [Bacillota bacterium]
MLKKECIYPESAPIPAGPYSPALRVDNFVFVSGQTPEKPGTDQLVEGDITIQAEQVFENINNILSAAGCTLNNVVKVTTFLSDIKDFEQYNQVYKKHFSKPYPARTTVQAVIPGGALLEIEVIALV